MQRIALFGGTFDPIHNGHLHSALELVERANLQTVHMVPCHQPVHRGEPQLTAAQRFSLLTLACADYDALLADDIELRRGGGSYSIDTFQALRHHYGDDAQLSFVMGADAFKHFARWHRCNDFFAIGNVIVVWRGGQSPPNLCETPWQNVVKSFEDAIQCSRGALSSVQLTPWEISSTQIRKQLADGKSVQQFLPEPVWQFIADQQLYR